jgi:hypothetical protein
MNSFLLIAQFIHVFTFNSYAGPARPLIVSDLETVISGRCLSLNTNSMPGLQKPQIEGSEQFTSAVHRIVKQAHLLGLNPDAAQKLAALKVTEVAGLSCDGRKAGGCKNNSQSISISNLDANNKKIAPNYGIIAHEIGHIVGDAISRRDDFNQIACLNKISTYCNHKSSEGHQHEAFAEAFAAYLTNPEYLKEKCLEAYLYIQKNIFDGKTESRCDATFTVSKKCDEKVTNAEKKNMSSLQEIKDLLEINVHSQKWSLPVQ